MMEKDRDRAFLGKAIDIALKGMKKGGGPFGAVIVYDGREIASACNRVVLSNDPTAHAEILAIREASRKMKTHDLSMCTLYTSCEPCPMCLGAIYWAGIQKVIYALDRRDAAKAGFSDELIYNELALGPDGRKISFIRLDAPNAGEIFTSWENLEDKVPY